MCLILLANGVHPDYPLVLAANRDEFFDRPTERASFWDDDHSVLAGRDSRAGGTWLGINTSGRLAAVTNYREPYNDLPGKESRGILVSNFLRGTEDALLYAGRISDSRDAYNGYNLILFDGGKLVYTSNRYPGKSIVVEPGVHGISNHVIDTMWPKVSEGTAALTALLNGGDTVTEDFFAILQSRTPAPDELLPDTGVGMDLERSLSPAFINLSGYGTRCSTVVLFSRRGVVTFAERSFDETGMSSGTIEYELHL